jgi:hypothetical protein
MQYVFWKDNKGKLRDQNNVVFLTETNFFNYEQIKKPKSNKSNKSNKTKKNKKTSLSSLLRKDTFKVIYSNSLN